MQLVGPYNSGVAVGANGAALASADQKVTISGKLVGIYVKYNVSCPSSTVVTIKTLGGGAPSYNLLAVPAGNTAGLFLVGQTMVNAAGAALTFDGTHGAIQGIPIYDGINVAITLANAACNADVWLFLE